MTQTPGGDEDDDRDWVDGRIRFDQRAFDNLKLIWPDQPVLASWLKYVYDRDRSGREGVAEIAKWAAHDLLLRYGVASQRPDLMLDRAWPIHGIYLYVKNAPSFHALFLTGIDAALRAFYRTHVDGWRDVGQGKRPPPRN